MAHWHAGRYMMGVERRMQVSDMAHGVLAFNVSGGCGAAGGTSSQRLAWLPTIDVRSLAFMGVAAVLWDSPHLLGEWCMAVMRRALVLCLYGRTCLRAPRLVRLYQAGRSWPLYNYIM